MKNIRHQKILQIIAQNDISTQEQLMNELNKEGIRATQATISRDIKQLRLVKQVGPYGAMRYVVSLSQESPTASIKLEKIFRECITHCDSTQNLVVIKTMAGMASAAGSAIDKMMLKTVVGCIAGDDTLFVAMRDNAAAAAFCEEIREQL